MQPGITINMTAAGEFEISVNELGRDLLVRELQGLSERSDRFHLTEAAAEFHVGNTMFDHRIMQGELCRYQSGDGNQGVILTGRTRQRPSLVRVEAERRYDKR